MIVLKNECSRLPALERQLGKTGAQAFVIQHDWVGVFKEAGLGKMEAQSPYDTCAFEFKVRFEPDQPAVCFTVLTRKKSPDSNEVEAMFFCLLPNGKWESATDLAAGAGMSTEDRHAFEDMCITHVAAALLALESEVAVGEVVDDTKQRKVNEHRARIGLPPLNSYRIVKVRDKRTEHAVAGDDEYKGTVRLHFRRGHWRDQNGKRVWVKWCLVGNPDLGFIDKEYRV